MRKKLILSQDACNKNEENKVIRRTITVEDLVNAFINGFRGRLLMNHNIELDYTSAMNMLAMFGIKYISKEGQNFTEEDMTIFNRYIYGAEELKFESIEDQLLEAFLSRRLPKLLKLTAEFQRRSSETVKQN